MSAISITAAMLLILVNLAVVYALFDSVAHDWPTTNIKRLNAEVVFRSAYCIASPINLAAPKVDRCTTIIVGKKAGVSGPMNTHTADCSDCDFRINKVVRCLTSHTRCPC